MEYPDLLYWGMLQASGKQTFHQCGEDICCTIFQAIIIIIIVLIIIPLHFL